MNKYCIKNRALWNAVGLSLYPWEVKNKSLLIYSRDQNEEYWLWNGWRAQIQVTTQTSLDYSALEKPVAINLAKYASCFYEASIRDVPEDYDGHPIFDSVFDDPIVKISIDARCYLEVENYKFAIWPIQFVWREYKYNNIPFKLDKLWITARDFYLLSCVARQGLFTSNPEIVLRLYELKSKNVLMAEFTINSKLAEINFCSLLYKKRIALFEGDSLKLTN